MANQLANVGGRMADNIGRAIDNYLYDELYDRATRGIGRLAARFDSNLGRPYNQDEGSYQLKRDNSKLRGANKPRVVDR